MTFAKLIESFQRCRSSYGGLFQIPESEGGLAAFTRVWGEALEGVDDDSGTAAFKVWCMTRDTPPTPAGILALTRPALPRAGEAWEEAWNLAASEGYGDGLVPVERFADPLAARAAIAVGWANLCGVNLPDDPTAAASRIAFLRRDFLRLYDELLTGNKDRDQRAIEGGFPLALMPHMKAIDSLPKGES